MREFKIAELSCVDRPAQQHATAVLMKRADGQEDEMILSFPDFESAVAHLAKTCGMSGSDAMSVCARRYPELLAKFQKEGDDRVAKALERYAPPTLRPGADEFEGAVHGIMSRDRCDRATAMSRARIEHPEAFREYQQQA